MNFYLVRPFCRVQNWFYNNAAAPRKKAVRALNSANKALAKAKSGLQIGKAKRVAGTSVAEHQVKISQLEAIVALQKKKVREARDCLEEVLEERKEQKETWKKLPRKPWTSKRGKAAQECGVASAVAGRVDEFEGWRSEDEMLAIAALLDLKNVWIMEA